MKYITELTLHNYRGYKHTVIPITSGLNVLYGEGGHGKSALVKAIRWCLLDERQKRFARKGILTKSGNIKTNEEVYVQANFNTGEVIRRGADSTTPNLYWIGHVDKPFEEWGDPIKNFKTVPDEVLKIINLSSVNVGKQFDLHFLLSQKGSEIAKDLNKMVNLEIIDSSQSNAKHFVTKVKREKESTEFNLVKYEKDLGSYDYLDAMGKALEEMEETEKRISESKDTMREVGLLLNTLDETAEYRGKYENTLSFRSSVEATQELDEEIETLSSKRAIVASTVSQLRQNKDLKHKYTKAINFKDVVTEISVFTKQCAELEETRADMAHLLCEAEIDTSSQRNIIDFKKEVMTMDDLDTQITELNSKFSEIDSLLEVIAGNGNLIIEKQKEVDELRNSLTGVCPTCGQSLENCKEVV